MNFRSIALALPLLVLCRFSLAQSQYVVPEVARAPQQLVNRFQTPVHVGTITFGVGEVAFSADNRYLAVAGNYVVLRHDRSRESLISVWEIGSGKLVSSFTTRGNVNFLAFSDLQGKELWSGAEEADDFGEVVRWNVQSGKPQKRFRCPDDLTFMAVSPDGSQIAVEPYGSVLLLDAKTLRVEKTIKFPEGEAIQEPLHYSDDGRLLLMNLFTKQKICIWDTRSGTLLRTVVLKNGECPYDIWFHGSKNQYLLWAGEWFDFRDAQSLRVVKKLGAYPSGTVVVSPSQKFVFSGDCDGPGDDPQYPYVVRVWNLETGALLLTLKGHTNNIRAGAFSSDELLPATGDENGRVNVWNTSHLHP